VTTITSESPDRKRRITIDPSSEIVTFINSYIPSKRSFFTLRGQQSEFMCPFADILAVYTLHDVGSNRGGLTPRVNTIQIATTSGNALFATNWINSDEAKEALTTICDSTANPPALRNPNIAIFPFIIGCLAIAGLVIALYFWVMGE
jgi:hypothetical protein